MKETLRKRIEELTAIVGIGGYEWDEGAGGAC